MQQNVCLSLAVAVLAGALLVGNPFLPERASNAVDGKQPAVDAVKPVALRAPAAAKPAPKPGSAGGAKHFAATPALAVSSKSTLPADASADLLCPDLALRPRVVSVERDDGGELVWVLRDGTRWARNPQRGDGQPVLIEVDAAASR